MVLQPVQSAPVTRACIFHLPRVTFSMGKGHNYHHPASLANPPNPRAVSCVVRPEQCNAWIPSFSLPSSTRPCFPESNKDNYIPLLATRACSALPSLFCRHFSSTLRPSSSVCSCCLYCSLLFPISRTRKYHCSPFPILMGSSSSKSHASTASSSTISSRRSSRSDLNNSSHSPTVPRQCRRNGSRESFTAAIDQGTTSSRFLVFDSFGTPRASYQMEFEQLYPHSG